MALHVCCYDGCYKQRFPCSSITFFQLPNDEPRRTQWILNSGNKQLLNLKTNQKRYICENHFQKTDIKPHFYRKLLYKNAVPMPHTYNNSNGSKAVTSTISDTTFTDFEEVEEVVDEGTEEAGTTLISYSPLLNVISEGEYKDTDIGVLDMSPTDFCIILEDTDTHIEENNIILEEPVHSDEETSEEILITTDVKNDFAAFAEFDTIAIDVDALVSSSIHATALTTTDIMTASSTTPNAYIEDAVKLKTDVETKISQVPKIDQSDSSYENDKHFALSLVYYFQRLNAKKKDQAKLDILNYLVELEAQRDESIVKCTVY